MKSCNTLGGRLPLLQRSELTDTQQRLFDHFMNTTVPWADSQGFQSRTSDNRLIGPFNAMLLSPVIAESFIDFQHTERGNSSLSPRVREVVILEVGDVWQSDYELYAHTSAARTAGLSVEQLSTSEQCAQRFARQLMTERRIDDDLYEEAQRTFGAAGIVEILLLLGAYQAVCGILNTFAIPAPLTVEDNHG